eukprot:9673990-Lingulodinium_polyedra.AAC.1
MATGSRKQGCSSERRPRAGSSPACWPAVWKSGQRAGAAAPGRLPSIASGSLVWEWRAGVA